MMAGSKRDETLEKNEFEGGECFSTNKWPAMWGGKLWTCQTGPISRSVGLKLAQLTGLGVPC